MPNHTSSATGTVRTIGWTLDKPSPRMPHGDIGHRVAKTREQIVIRIRIHGSPGLRTSGPGDNLGSSRVPNIDRTTHVRGRADQLHGGTRRLRNDVCLAPSGTTKAFPSALFARRIVSVTRNPLIDSSR